MNFFNYSLTFYDNITMEITDESGYTFGDSYTDAMERVLSFYGADEVERIELTFVSDRPVLITSKISNEAIVKQGLEKALNNHNTAI